MRKLLSILLCLATCPAFADILPLYDALRATYVACIGIDDALSDLKTMAGINTAVTGVGTATGVGATVTGIVKSTKDKQVAELEIKLEKLREIESKNPQSENSTANFNLFYQEFENSYTAISQQLKDYQSQIDKLTEQSKNLGNWRTGLLAGSTVTNIAGAAIAGTNRVDDDLRSQIDACVSAVDALQQSMMQARIDGLDISEAQNIVNACSEYRYVDISPIDNRAKGAMISSVVGATTGLAGTITSATANTRNDNTEEGRQKEKNLNTAANVLSGVTTAASATATVFNATQISAIKKVAEVAEKCTGVLR